MSAAVLQEGPSTVAPMAPMTPTHRTADGERITVVESWRVLTDSTGGTPATADAIVRLRTGGERLVVTGEAATAGAALADALRSAERINPGCCVDLSGSLQAHLADLQPGGNVALEATHEQGLVGRLTVLLNAHEVTSFSYRVVPETKVAMVELTVQGGNWHVSRVAHRLRRVIGVRRVTARLVDDGEDTVLEM